MKREDKQKFHVSKECAEKTLILFIQIDTRAMTHEDEPILLKDVA